MDNKKFLDLMMYRAKSKSAYLKVLKHLAYSVNSKKKNKRV